MTLCVAAACQDHGKPRIVLATDWRAETSSASGDIQDKLYCISGNIAVLVAGAVSRAVELRDTYKQFLQRREAEQAKKPDNEKEPITAANLIDILRTPLVIFKNKLANEYIGLKYGMTYKAFLSAVSKKDIPDGIAEKELAAVGRISFGCCLIILLFLDKEPYLLRIDEDGSLESCEHFAAIGSGQDIANGVLFQREHEYKDSLSRTIYCVYEAMKLGAIAPGVGEYFTLDVLYPEKEKGKEVYGEWLNKKGQAFMENEFKKRGPKAFSNFPRLPEKCLEKFSQ